MVQEEPQFLNVQKAASFLGAHPHTVRRWAHENKLQGKRIGARGDWRFTRETLQNMKRNDHAPGEASEGLKHSSSRRSTQHTQHASPTGLLAGGGEMGEHMRAMDWSKTPLGPVERWPQSLSTLVATCLRSRFPIVIWWDCQHYTMLYNDAYIPVLGKTKHPGWLGQSGRECWKELWPTIGPMFEGVFATGQPTWSEDLLLVMDRNLPLEETYFTFSYSAIPGETGLVDGIFCACTETTERVLSERRLRTLRDLASRAAEARSAEEACEVAAQLLAQNHADIPFALIYLLNRDRTFAHLVALSGLSPGSAAAVQSIQLSQLLHEDIWPLDEVARQAKPRLVRPLAGNFGTLPGGPWPESPKFTFTGNITVSLRQTKDGVEFSVQDTGVGIPQEELPHMFERFHRVKGTEGRTYEGTGIGLSLVQELVKLHGGTIRVQGGPGQGSTLTVSLPRGTAHLPHEGVAAQRTLASTALHAQIYVDEALSLLPEQEVGAAFLPEARQGLQQSAPPDNGKQTQTARILFADDNADMRVYVSRLLQQRYEVQAVADGKAALAAVKQSQPDLVLADVMMPKMDGFELLQALRSDPQTSTLPVILLSARAGEEARIEGMEAGADDYLIKPFSARELLARVGAHLEADRIRKEVERAVKTERERLYGLFWQAPAAIAVVEGQHHVYTLANPLYQKLCNRTQKELLGRTIREVFPELAGQGVYEAFDTVYTSGEPFVANEFLATFARSVNGAPEQRYFNVVGHPIQDNNHHVERILVHAVEVTDLVKAREHIKTSEERFHTLADNIPNLVWMAHPDGWVYWYNSRWYDYTGTTPVQMACIIPF